LKLLSDLGGRRLKKPIYKKWWFWVVLILVIGAIGNMGENDKSTDLATPSASVEPAKPVIADATIEPTEAPTEKPTTAPTTEPTEQPIPGTIGMTPEEFKAAFNKVSSNDSVNFKINELTVEEGEEQDTFTYALANDYGFTASINKADGSIREVILIGSQFESPDSVMNYFTAISTTIKATTPDLEPEDIQKMFKTLGILGEGADLTDVDTEVVRDNIKYSLRNTGQLGVWFTVSDANE
jgi:hypothetical protein